MDAKAPKKIKKSLTAAEEEMLKRLQAMKIEAEKSKIIEDEESED